MIFRKVALERLSSPEQLDQLMEVTSPRGWLALVALGALLLVALTWGIFGSIPSKATGEGILIRQGGVSNVVATGSGQLEEIKVTVGDVLTAGQVVASVRQDPLQRQIQEAESKLAQLRVDYQSLLAYGEEQRRLKARDRSQQRANLQQSIKRLEQDGSLLEEKLVVQASLLEQGLITKQTLLDTQQALNASRDALAGSRLQLDGLDLKRLEAEQDLEQQLDARRLSLRDQESQLRELKAKLVENASVVSPFDGRVLELMAGPGDLVSPGTPLVTVEVVSEELMAVIYVPASTGKQVQPGMAVQISPSTVKQEEYGYMLGVVSRVAEFPSTTRGMMSLLANQDLVSQLTAQGLPIQANVELLRDQATPTGYRWSSSKGPNVKISSGTLAVGSIIVKRDRPIRLVIPVVREKLGI